jgi:methylenetetrahydrofolate dehydrogenase (NADP+) / methenyltetrahydrofolate cyclohydrolase
MEATSNAGVSRTSSSRGSPGSTVRLLIGKPLAEKLHDRSRELSAALHAKGIAPRLAAVSVGIDPAANTYQQRLSARGNKLDISVDDVDLPGDTAERQLVATLERLGADSRVHGILLLTPLPGRLDEGHIVDHIVPSKDVEGMNPFNVGLLADGRPRFVPSTAEAVIELLKFHGVALRGAWAAVIGRSTVVGRPVAYLLLKEDATVTIAHSQTNDVGEITRSATIVVVGVGRAGYLKGNMLAPGTTVIDAGINVTPHGLVGDVDVESVSSVAAALSPVPGGLGSVTTELLLRNVLTAAERQLED